MLQEFVLFGAKEPAEEVDTIKEPADTSRAEETVSLPLPSLRDSDRFPTSTLSRCRHGFDISVSRLRPDLLETTAASIAVAIEACPFAPESVILPDCP
jgi:hypothetical protein